MGRCPRQAARGAPPERQQGRRHFSVLKISFDDMADEDQDVFMDVACVLLGQSSEEAVCAWGDSLGLDNLVSLSLVSIDGQGRLGMHDQLRDMGRSFTLKAGSRFRDKYVWDEKVCLCLCPRPDSGNAAAACHQCWRTSDFKIVQHAFTGPLWFLEMMPTKNLFGMDVKGLVFRHPAALTSRPAVAMHGSLVHPDMLHVA